ncbi:hypothetical protein J8273_0685 [Carpediemonas membranifera]|uniref:Uncharacterized protein n=1 Tax=Carpediemonas membranifera TaxID=201153 RepID=A0A8J6EBK8_9EUKA|nr:hypothetical protein J8273_0685 [Carpediemonas membranifera]|eukprot:KAG9397555.1 hypothetical protein J8273_0685 [Carpediemonas membranifera]
MKLYLCLCDRNDENGGQGQHSSHSRRSRSTVELTDVGKLVRASIESKRSNSEAYFNYAFEFKTDSADEQYTHAIEAVESIVGDLLTSSSRGGTNVGLLQGYVDPVPSNSLLLRQDGLLMSLLDSLEPTECGVTALSISDRDREVYDLLSGIITPERRALMGKTIPSPFESVEYTATADGAQLEDPTIIPMEIVKNEALRIVLASTARPDLGRHTVIIVHRPVGPMVLVQLAGPTTKGAVAVAGCLKALLGGADHVPFRDSFLSFVLQPYLGYETNIASIWSISDSPSKIVDNQRLIRSSFDQFQQAGLDAGLDLTPYFSSTVVSNATTPRVLLRKSSSSLPRPRKISRRHHDSTASLPCQQAGTSRLSTSTQPAVRKVTRQQIVDTIGSHLTGLENFVQSVSMNFPKSTPQTPHSRDRTQLRLRDLESSQGQRQSRSMDPDMFMRTRIEV